VFLHLETQKDAMACAAARPGLLQSLAGGINRDDGDLPVCGVVAGKLPEEDRMPEPKRPGAGAQDRLEAARMRLFVEPGMSSASLGIDGPVCRGTERQVPIGLRYRPW